MLVFKRNPFFTTLVFVVDWQAPVLTEIGRLQARDADEHAQLVYHIEEVQAAGQDDSNASGSAFFVLNASSGVLTLQRSLQQADASVEAFRMRVAVTDGTHTVHAPLEVDHFEIILEDFF